MNEQRKPPSASRADQDRGLVVGRRGAGDETAHVFQQAVDRRGFRVEVTSDPLGSVLLFGRARRLGQAVGVEKETAPGGQLHLALWARPVTNAQRGTDLGRGKTPRGRIEATT